MPSALRTSASRASNSSVFSVRSVFTFLAALPEPLAAIGEPGAALLHDASLDRQIEQVSRAGNPFAVHDVELRHAEWRRQLVLHHLHARASPDHPVGVLDGSNAPDVDAHGRVELQRPAAGGRFRVAEHHADLLAQLVDEQEAGTRLRHHAGQLPQRLRHQAGLQPDLRVAHLALDFGPWHEGGDRVDDDDVDGARAHQGLDDLQRLLAVIRLRDQEVVELHPELARVDRVQRVFRVDERRVAARPLGLRDDLQGERRLAGGFGSVDLDHAAARNAADAERMVDADGSGRDARYRRHRAARTEAHDRALAELLLYLADGDLDGFGAFAGYSLGGRHGLSILHAGHGTACGKTYSRIVPGACQAKVDFNTDANSLFMDVYRVLDFRRRGRGAAVFASRRAIPVEDSAFAPPPIGRWRDGDTMRRSVRTHGVVARDGGGRVRRAGSLRRRGSRRRRTTPGSSWRNPASHRERRGARVARRDEGAYRAVFDRGATQSRRDASPLECSGGFCYGLPAPAQGRGAR